MTYDGRPSLIPAWPDSEQMALVCVFETPEGSEWPTDAFVCLSPEAMIYASDPRRSYRMRRLFFTVPKELLLAEDVCPDLDQQSFWRQDS